MLLRAAAAAAVLLAASPAVARMHAGPSQLHAGHRLQGAIAPLDGGGSFAAPAAAYSMRRLKSTYAGPGIKLRRASDSTAQDINFLGFTGFTGAPLDVAAAAAFCASTTCFISTWYDQSGNARNVVQATAGNQPQYIADCGGGLPCAVATPTAQVLVGPSVTPAASQSFSVVGKSGPPAESCVFGQVASNQLGSNSSDLWWVLWNGSAPSIATGVAHGVWHSGHGWFDAPYGWVVVDGGVEAANTMAATLTAGTIGVSAGGGSGTIACATREVIWWNNYALMPAERAVLTSNQRAYWRF